jgi:hypothetical protein
MENRFSVFPWVSFEKLFQVGWFALYRWAAAPLASRFPELAGSAAAFSWRGPHSTLQILSSEWRNAQLLALGIGQFSKSINLCQLFNAAHRGQRRVLAGSYGRLRAGSANSWTRSRTALMQRRAVWREEIQAEPTTDGERKSPRRGAISLGTLA